MPRGISRKTLLVAAAAVALSMAPVSGLASDEQIQYGPTDYSLDYGIVKIQTLLTEKGFYRGPIDGVVSDEMGQAIQTFHKAADLERTTEWLPGDLRVLRTWESQVPEMPDQPDRVEVDLQRQVLHLVLNGEIVQTLPISSGNGEWYKSYRPGAGFVRANTPSGEYHAYHHIPRWRIAALGGLYKPWYFLGGFAIHGSRSVPPYPASHGCVRVTLDDADWLQQHLYIGIPINLRKSIPRNPTPVSVLRPFTDPLGMYSDSGTVTDTAAAGAPLWFRP